MLALAVHLPAALVPHGPPRECYLSRRSAVGAAGGVLAALSLRDLASSKLKVKGKGKS